MTVEHLARGHRAAAQRGLPVFAGRRQLDLAKAEVDHPVEEVLLYRSGRRTGRRVAAGDGQSAVRFHACPADRPRFSDGRPLGPWTGYPGGFLVDRPGCARLTASAPRMRTVRRRVALGVAAAQCSQSGR